MLRQMVFKNFIHFEDFQCLTFEKGSHFFIGANSSGKTSALEILRRCMSTDINTSISSSYDESENAYAFCEFHIKVNTTIRNFKNISSVYSGVIKTPGPDKRFVKIICLKKRDSPLSVIQMIYYDNIENDTLTEPYRMTANAETSQRLTEILASLSSASTSDEQTNFDQHFIQCVLESREKFPSITDDEIQRHWTDEGIAVENFKYNLKHMKFLKDLESTYVATMPMRAIGALQWTRSENIACKGKNYTEACKRAEIINTLLTSEDVDHVKADSIFKFLTNPSKYEFEPTQNPNEIFVKETYSSKFHLLKTPEGVIEAKQFSLIMAHKNFNTICLEEPDRCMHPQMVERMRDILRSESRDKVVIVISHNPFLINSITAEKTHVFFRKKTHEYSSKVSCGIHAICDINRRITDVDTLKKLIFAAKILCVEGISDKIILEGLFDYIVGSTYVVRDERHSIISHQMVVLGSKTFDTPISDFCKKTGLSAKWLFDRDKYITLDETKKKIAGFKTLKDSYGNYSQFEDRAIEDFLKEKNGFDKLSDKLSYEGIFIWKFGDLEDTIINSLNPVKQKHIFDVIAPDLNDKTTEEAVEATQEFKETIKYKLTHMERRKLETLAKEMYHSQQSNEVKRFFEFMKMEQ
ncbi:uncharacterized protein LOC134683492 [Mytilus trossulus]|uniref:uncharacterized protein LOC134683492 n=1 Tax=Mytilus trossulus TaxID=6551 RepID=UPI003004A2DB